MSIINPLSWFNDNKIDEEIKAFKSKENKLTDKQYKNQSGEAYTDLIQGYGAYGMGSFQSFYNKYIDEQRKGTIQNISKYREMSKAPEISDVIEDAVNESLQEDDNNRTINLYFSDQEIEKKDTLTKNLYHEFNQLFYETLDINELLFEYLWTYYTDGVLWLENVINETNQKQGIINLKKLPPESMDTVFDEFGRVSFYIQYLKKGTKKPSTWEEAKNDTNIIPFYTSQISVIKFSGDGGYLEKSKIPYNQLKLLETSMIIYRIVRAPERYVFKIDTGNMPRDKAMKYVEKIKNKMNKKQTFDPDSGKLESNTAITSIQDNFFIPQGENRGSDISTIGGSNIGFRELDDIYFFQKKLYRALKYPLSRVENKMENRSSDNLFGGSDTAEIVRDEIKWAKFLERHQRKISRVFLNIFLLHLKFKGFKNNVDKNTIYLAFNPPSDYKDQMKQQLLRTQMDNYMNLSNEEEFSKYYLMNKYLGWTEEEIQENVKGLKKDKELGFKSEEGMGF